MMTPRPMRVLFGTDGSPDARAAGAWLAAFPLPESVRLFVVTVTPPPPSPIAIEGLAEFSRALLDEAQQVAEEAAAGLRPRWPDLEIRVPTGDPREELVRLADEVDADLIVVGARGLGAVGTAILGSVSVAVTRHAPCPVLVIKPQPRPLRTVMVAVDGSEDAAEAAAFVARLPLPPTTAVRVVGVAEPPQLPGWAPSLPNVRTAVDEVFAERRRSLEAALADVAGRLHGATTRVLVGPPAATLEGTVEETDADLVVVGARGLGTVKRLLLGSVSERVLRHARCAVLVVKGRAR